MIPMYHKVVLHWSSEASSAPPWSSTLLPTWLVLLSVGPVRWSDRAKFLPSKKKDCGQLARYLGGDNGERWSRFPELYSRWWCWHPVFYRSQLRKSNKTRKLGSWDHVGITMGIIRYNPTTLSEFLTLVPWLFFPLRIWPCLGGPVFHPSSIACHLFFPWWKPQSTDLFVEGPK